MKPITTAELESRKLIFSVWGNYVVNGISPEMFEKEKAFYLNVPVENPSPQQLELIALEKNRKEVEAFSNAIDAVPAKVEALRIALESVGLEALPLFINK